jgi:hypothetical protein
MDASTDRHFKRPGAEVGVFFEGVGPDSSDEKLRAIPPRHPVFRLTAVTPAQVGEGQADRTN